MANTTVLPLRKRESWTKGGPVVSHLDDDEITALEERAAATVGDPSVLGLWSFATGTWIFGTVIAGVFTPPAYTALIPILFLFGGVVQFIAGLFAFRRANVLSATMFCCFGGFYGSAAFLFALEAANSVTAAGSTAVLHGFVFESFAFIALALAAAALRANMAMVAVFITLCIGYCLSGIPFLANAAGTPGWSIVQSIGGWFMVASAFFAYYTGMALVVNSIWSRTLLPLFGEA